MKLHYKHQKPNKLQHYREMEITPRKPVNVNHQEIKLLTFTSIVQSILMQNLLEIDDLKKIQTRYVI